MKIDSGSQVNILPRSTFQSPGIKCRLQKTPKRLTAYGGGNFKVGGYIRLDCTYNDKTISEEFYVAETKSSPIRGPPGFTCWIYFAPVFSLFTVESLSLFMSLLYLDYLELRQ